MTTDSAPRFTRYNMEVAFRAGGEAAESKLAAQAGMIEEAKEVLERLGRSRDCGCRPCTGQCTSNEALLIEAEEMRDTARALLSRLNGEGQ
jgi:hypothetical protein